MMLSLKEKLITDYLMILIFGEKLITDYSMILILREKLITVMTLILRVKLTKSAACTTVQCDSRRQGHRRGQEWDQVLKQTEVID